MEKKTLNKNCIEINIFYFPFQLTIAQYNDSIKIEIMLTHMSDFTEKKNVSGNSCILSFLDLYCRICCLIFLFISVIWFEQKKLPSFYTKVQKEQVYMLTIVVRYHDLGEDPKLSFRSWKPRFIWKGNILIYDYDKQIPNLSDTFVKIQAGI